MEATNQRRRQEPREPENHTEVEPWRIEFTSDSGKTLGLLSPEEKTFKTGSRGYYAGGKCEFYGRKFQVSCSIVEIGSKPEEKVKH